MYTNGDIDSVDTGLVTDNCNQCKKKKTDMIKTELLKLIPKIKDNNVVIKIEPKKNIRMVNLCWSFQKSTTIS